MATAFPKLFDLRAATLLLALVFLAGCGELRPKSEHPYYLHHRVQAGETLYSIAWRYGYDYRELAAWNRIDPPYQIFPNQALVVLAPDPSRRPEKDPPDDISEETPATEEEEVTDEEGQPAEAEPAEVQAPTQGWIPIQPPAAPVGQGAAGGAAVAKGAAVAAKGTVINQKGSTAPKKKAAKEGAKKPSPVTSPKKRKKPAKELHAPQKSSGKKTAKAKAGSKDTIKTKTHIPPLVRSNFPWAWPTQGKILVRFSAVNGRKGIDLGGKLGQPVKAAASGSVVYSGSGLMGYGNLIIIKHDDVFLSAYGFNRRLLVKEGDKVNAGKVIAEMGQSPKTGSILHFEIRRNGKPVDPLLYLPKQTS